MRVVVASSGQTGQLRHRRSTECEARTSYPAAKQRYLAGLPEGQAFYVTTALHDAKGREENVFIGVQRIENGQVTGPIVNEILRIRCRQPAYLASILV